MGERRRQPEVTHTAEDDVGPWGRLHALADAHRAAQEAGDLERAEALREEYLQLRRTLSDR
ncbi:MAG: hypothetical protein VYE22_16350 [Myxococcota bacterium]|nr:hypothetical protein [Myxococcota bacterium]